MKEQEALPKHPQSFQPLQPEEKKKAFADVEKEWVHWESHKAKGWAPFPKAIINDVLKSYLGQHLQTQTQARCS